MRPVYSICAWLAGLCLAAVVLAGDSCVGGVTGVTPAWVHSGHAYFSPTHSVYDCSGFCGYNERAGGCACPPYA